MGKMSWRYLAGYMDGEGSLLLGIARDKRAKSQGGIDGWTLLPNLCVTTYDYEILRAIKSFLEENGIKVYKLERKARHGSNLRDSIRLSVLGWGNIEKCIRKLLPHIIDKRRQFELFRGLCAVIKNKPFHPANLYHKRIWTKAYFLIAMEIIDEINSYKKGNRGKYNANYFRNLWHMEVTQ